MFFFLDWLFLQYFQVWLYDSLDHSTSFHAQIYLSLPPPVYFTFYDEWERKINNKKDCVAREYARLIFKITVISIYKNVVSQVYKWRGLNAMVNLHKTMFKAEIGINII